MVFQNSRERGVGKTINITIEVWLGLRLDEWDCGVVERLFHPPAAERIGGGAYDILAFKSWREPPFLVSLASAIKKGVLMAHSLLMLRH